MNTNYDVVIVGAGLSGSVLAERFAKDGNKKVLIIEKRDHIGGNCFDYVDQETGIRLNKYGAHLFHTDDEEVWSYVQQFGKWTRWDHKVIAKVDDRFVSIPVNITTINELCGTNIQTGIELTKWLEENQCVYDVITNSEEMAKSRIGTELYEKLIKNYTYKQWNRYPDELSKSVLSRIPIRMDHDTRYFSDKFQALPTNGYTSIFENMLNHPNIEVRINTDYFEFRKSVQLDDSCIVIFTGPIDHYFAGKGLPPLEYRSIDFHIERIKNMMYYQPNSVVNYPSNDVPYTRTVEYKHFLNQRSVDTIIVSETTNDHGDPYYPVPSEKNIELYEKYRKLIESEKNVYFVGRMATYKYINMDQAIRYALDLYEKIKK